MNTLFNLIWRKHFSVAFIKFLLHNYIYYEVLWVTYHNDYCMVVRSSHLWLTCDYYRELIILSWLNYLIYENQRSHEDVWGLGSSERWLGKYVQQTKELSTLNTDVWRSLTSCGPLTL